MKWRSEANFRDPYSERVILGCQACSNNRPNGIILDPWFELVILGPTVSCCLLLLHILVVPSSSCIFLRITKVQLLGSITFSYILKLILARKEFNFCWSSLAWVHVIGP
jgi:hypothetical protein